jgi:hypothetical protein
MDGVFIKKMLIIVICVQFIMCIYYKSLSRVDDSEEHSRLQWSDICVEKRNFVFIKCMKCATEKFGINSVYCDHLPDKRH